MAETIALPEALLEGIQRQGTPQPRLPWVELDNGDLGITRACMDKDGNFVLQHLHMQQSRMIAVQAPALSLLRTLLGVEPRNADTVVAAAAQLYYTLGCMLERWRVDARLMAGDVEALTERHATLERALVAQEQGR
jgi:hypothetical protein